MANVREPSFVSRLKQALSKELAAVGIDNEVDYQPIRGTKLYRFMVLAKKFDPLQHTERQDLVWRIADRALSADEQLRISMIMTLTPEEAGDIPDEVKVRR